MFDLVNSAMQVLAQLGEAAPAVQSAAGAAVGAATPALAGAGTSATDVAQGGMLHFISQSDVVGKSLFGILVLMSLRSEEHTSELQSLMRISYAVFCLKNKIQNMKY